MTKAIVKVASNMSDETYDFLCNGIREKYGEEIVFQKITDDSIIGGFILTLDGTVYDNSVGTQLKELKKHITK